MRARIWILALLYVLTSVVLVVEVWLALDEEQVLQARSHRLHLEELLNLRENIARTSSHHFPDDEAPEIIAADLIPQLPVSGKHEIGRGNLIDAKGREQYSWGSNQPAAALHPLI